MVKYEEILVEGDILLSDSEFFRVIYIDATKKTMDLKSYNKHLIYKCVPINNLYDTEVMILKEIPKNVTFLHK